MPTYKATWKGARTALEAASVTLTEVLYPPADATSLTDPDNAGDWTLDAYFAQYPDEAALAEALAASGAAFEGVEELPDIDWVAHALEGLGVVEAGRFLLYGVHDADKVAAREDVIPIRIDANQAFGTGHHPTTEGCLTLLDRLAGFIPKSVLDLGTGSAVLAIAARKIWDCPIIATDIDEKSVEIARENAALNEAHGIDFAVADGFAHDAVVAGAPYDFVFANILAGPLVEFAPAMARHVRPSGRVMLAGLMSEQEEKVRAAYEGAGFRLLNRLDHKVWPVLLFVRLPGS